MRLPIATLAPYCTISEIRRLEGQKSPIRIYYHSYLTPSLGVIHFEFRAEPTFAKTRVFGLSGDEEIMTLSLFVLIQCQSVMDRQTVRQTDRQTSLL